MKSFLIAPLLAMLGLGGCARADTSDVGAPFTLEREIALPDVKGRIDHLAVDVAHRRLFVAEIANGTVDSIDLSNGLGAIRVPVTTIVAASAGNVSTAAA